MVDDNETILKRVTATLARVYEIAGAVKDGASALDAVRLLRPDVVVLDISMPGMSGLDVVCRLCRAGSAIRVVFLTMHNEPELVLPFADIEGDALSHAKLLRSLSANGLEPPGISSQVQLFIHWHLQAAASVHCQAHARLGADRRTVGGENGRPVLR